MLACQTVADAPDSVMMTLGGSVGGAIVQFQVNPLAFPRRIFQEVDAIPVIEKRYPPKQSTPCPAPADFVKIVVLAAVLVGPNRRKTVCR